MSTHRQLWEILVPTIRRVGGKPYTTRFHRVWDKKVREISRGLTILAPSKGQWISPDGELFVERMIPVRFLGTRMEADKVVDITMLYYDQLAILCYQISSVVILKHKPGLAQLIKIEPCNIKPMTEDQLLSPSMKLRVRYTD